jgi:hypothetical protein
MLEIGKNYKREEIAAELGGSTRGFLPIVKGKVVCVCLREGLNPSAPKIILAGSGLHREKPAAVLCKQVGELPVFVKWENENNWEHVGRFEVEKFSTNPEEIKQHDNRKNPTEKISRVIFLKESSKSKSLRLCASAVKS